MKTFEGNLYVVPSYDNLYREANHFHYREWLYRPYVKALAQKAGLHSGCRLLDAGCGQGFFTHLFRDLGFDASGVDLSETGIATARASYGDHFAVGDLLALEGEFDCIFTRSCSLYNDASFPDLTTVTDALLAHLKPGGVFIFDYYSRLGRKGSDWRYHSLEDVRAHFSKYNAQTFFSSRLDTLVLGSYALNAGVTSFNQFVSRHSGVGGELIAILKV